MNIIMKKFPNRIELISKRSINITKDFFLHMSIKRKEFPIEIKEV